MFQENQYPDVEVVEILAIETEPLLASTQFKQEVITDLSQFYNPVCEQPLEYVSPIYNDIVISNEFKGIYDGLTGQLIHPHLNSYKVVTNQEVIEPVLNVLTNLGFNYQFGKKQSYCHLGWMKLQVIFPDILFLDNDSKSALTLDIYNSYNKSYKAIMQFGGLREVCTNGMTLWKILGRYVRKHTSGFNIDEFKRVLNKGMQSVPVVQERIQLLESIEAKSELLLAIENEFPKAVKEYVNVEHKSGMSEWDVYNILTHYISHEIKKQHLIADYSNRASQLFNL
ncbi:MAG: DUF932 domain-containing protein [Bacteroidetes bacterium]|nr:DUF932 domain-containing protein [Bacteroidota bacterium]